MLPIARYLNQKIRTIKFDEQICSTKKRMMNLPTPAEDRFEASQVELVICGVSLDQNAGLLFISKFA